MVLCSIGTSSTLATAPAVVLSHLTVAANSRRAGVGRVLVAAATQWAAECDVDHLRVAVYAVPRGQPVLRPARLRPGLRQPGGARRGAAPHPRRRGACSRGRQRSTERAGAGCVSGSPEAAAGPPLPQGAASPAREPGRGSPVARRSSRRAARFISDQQPARAAGCVRGAAGSRRCSTCLRGRRAGNSWRC